MSEPKHTIVIAVDGPAASGKSSFATALAAHLGYAYLDTGTLYRMIALATLQRGGDPSNLEDIKPVLGIIKFPLAPEQFASPELRTPEVDEATPHVGAMSEVQAIIHQYQAAFIKNPPGNAAGAVLDGRDIGTVVCPDADVKFFVTAAAEERARRRFAEQKSSYPGLTQEMVLKDINLQDMNRKSAPLRAATDAYILDTTNAKPDETLQLGLSIVKTKLSEAPRNKAPDGPKNTGPKI